MCYLRNHEFKPFNINLTLNKCTDRSNFSKDFFSMMISVLITDRHKMMNHVSQDIWIIKGWDLSKVYKILSSGDQYDPVFRSLI